MPKKPSSKGLSGRKREETRKDTPRTNHLLVIGIDQYQQGIRPLQNAVRDAKNVRDVLWKKYQFDKAHTIELYDGKATRQAIYDQLDQLLNILGPADNLLVYFSGHGELIELYQRGYWIPADAIFGQRSTYLPNFEVLDFFKKCKAHHILGIVDSCFSGTLFSRRLSSVSERLSNIPSRWLLSSGREELVSDGFEGENSPFAQSLISHLEHNNEDQLWTSDLCTRVLRGVAYNAKQTPRGAPLQNAGDQGGEFVFQRIGTSPPPVKKPTAKPAVKKTPVSSPAAKKTSISTAPTAVVEARTSFPWYSILFVAGVVLALLYFFDPFNFFDRTEAETSFFSDPRDGQHYQTVRLKDGKIWMAENLNYMLMDSWCYDQNSPNCLEYGRLYTWEQALTVCPDGWHLPSEVEWSNMLNFYGELSYNTNRWEGAHPSLVRSNRTAFLAQMGGKKLSDSDFKDLDSHGYYWTSTNDILSLAKNILFDTNYRTISLTGENRFSGLSCRCVKD